MLTNKKVLITNDDGIEGKGLLALVKEVYIYTHDIIVLCPAHEMSAVSQARTFRKGLEFKQVKSVYKDVITYTLDGTPADCVRFADCVLKIKFDYVISGANNGLNMGDDILYSGTVGACFEANFIGSKALAVSVPANNFEAIKSFKDCITYIKENNLDNYPLLNINLREEYLGIKVTRQGRFQFNTWYRFDENTKVYYCEGEPITEFDDQDDDSDVKCYYNGYISISKLTTDRSI